MAGTEPRSRLLHLNGPPGIGKSTLARRYAAEHPGVLLLDVDVVSTLLPGLSFRESGPVRRPLALAMASAHLSAGRDVVLPQFLARVSEIERFEAAATSVGASFVEVMVTDERDNAVARFDRRGADDDDDPWHEQVREVVLEMGGDDYLRDMYDALAGVLAERSSYVVVRSVEGELDATYEALLRALDT